MTEPRYVLFALSRQTYTAGHALALEEAGVSTPAPRWSRNTRNGIVRLPSAGALPPAFADGTFTTLDHARALRLMAHHAWSEADGQPSAEEK